MRRTGTGFFKMIAFVFLWAFVPTACNNVPDLPVSEPLPGNRLQKICKNNPDFIMVYRVAESRNGKFSGTTGKKEWAGLTYRRLYEFYLSITNYEFQRAQEKTIKERWEKRYGFIPSVADSLSHVWKRFLEDRDPDTYVRIELAEINKKYDRSIPGGENFPEEIEFILEIVPLRGPLNGLEAYYDICAHGSEPDYGRLEISGHNRILIRKEFSDAIKVKNFPVLNGEVMEFLQGETNIKELKENYGLHFRVASLMIDSVKITPRSLELQVPEQVRRLWAIERVPSDGGPEIAPESFPRENVLREKAVKEIASALLDCTYLSPREYYDDCFRNTCLQIDSLAARFYFGE